MIQKTQHSIYKRDGSPAVSFPFSRFLRSVVVKRSVL